MEEMCSRACAALSCALILILPAELETENFNPLAPEVISFLYLCPVYPAAPPATAPPVPPAVAPAPPPTVAPMTAHTGIDSPNVKMAGTTPTSAPTAPPVRTP